MNNILFSEFKKSFYGRVKDFSLFDCQEFNLLKVVLDGLLVRYTERGKISNYFAYPVSIYQTILILKNLRAKQNPRLGKLKHLNLLIEQHAGKKYLFNEAYDWAYLKKTGKKKPFFFHSILNDSNRSNAVFCVEQNQDGKSFSDIDLSLYKEIIITRRLEKEECELIYELKKTFKKIKECGIFTDKELKNISISFELFYLQFRLWRYVINRIKPQKFIFRCHYHREGTLLACKRAGVKSIELQHGLIAPEDIFYMMPQEIKQVAPRALFADRIWVYGNYWKDRLKIGHEYSEDKIDVIGYYPLDNSYSDYEQESEIDKIIRNKKVILIASQFYAHKYFIEYIQWLAYDLMKREDKDEYIIILKPHPHEQEGIYDELKLIPNVNIVNADIQLLLKKAFLLISIYSTVIYEAKRYNIPCFSLYIDEYMDYVDTFVKTGISNKLMMNQNPLLVSSVTSTIKKEELFGELNCELISTELS